MVEIGNCVLKNIKYYVCSSSVYLAVNKTFTNLFIQFGLSKSHNVHPPDWIITLSSFVSSFLIQSFSILMWYLNKQNCVPNRYTKIATLHKIKFEYYTFNIWFDLWMLMVNICWNDWNDIDVQLYIVGIVQWLHYPSCSGTLFHLFHSGGNER